MSLKRFAKETAIYGVATVLPRVISILLLGLFTSELRSAQFSDATDFWIFAALFNVVLTYGMETSFFRYFTKLKGDTKVIDTSFTAILITSLVFLATMLLFRDQVSGILRVDTLYFSILVFVTVLDTIVVIPFAWLRVTNRPMRFAVIKLANIVVYFLAILIFFKGINFFISDNTVNSAFLNAFLRPENKAVYIFIATLLASSVTVLIFLPLIMKIRLSLDRALFFDMLKYGYPIMIAGLAFVINENLDKYLLKRMISDELMGAYAATYKIGTFMALYITAFRLGAEPFFFSQASAKDAKEKYAAIMLWFTIAGAVFFLAIIAYLDVITWIFIRRPEYFTTLAIVPVILISNLLLGIYHNLSIWYKLTDRTRFGMYISVLGAVITIILNLVFIPIIGYMAAAWATFAAYGSMALISWYLGRKYYPVPYDILRILFYLGSSALLAFVIFNFFYSSFIIKNIMLLAYIAMVYMLEKNSLKRLIKSAL